MAFFELREYKIRRGKKTAWLKMFDEEVMPFEVARGIVPCGLWHGETDESVFIWMRRFNSEKERVRLCAAVYSDPYWLEELAPRRPGSSGSCQTRNPTCSNPQTPAPCPGGFKARPYTNTQRS